MDAFSLSMETSGVESTLFILNIGFILFIVIAHFILCAIHAIIYKFQSKSLCAKKIIGRLGSYLYFNGLLRLYMEVFMDMTLLSCLNLHTVEWESPFTSV